MTLWLLAAGLALGTPSLQAAQKDVTSLLARSKVWMPVDVPSMDLWRGPQGDGSFEPGATIACTYLDRTMTGASPKFTCRMDDGEELKVKYGGENGEIYGEVIATRLLWALGFGADRMYSVRVICRGCPARIGGIERADGDRILEPAAVERRMPGRKLLEHWSWHELDRIDASAGGATDAERDALKLLAVLIQHSDSKPQQQRLICVEGYEESAGACDEPLMMINDLGITFGRATTFNTQPRGSVNLAEWSNLPVWKDGVGCVGNLAGSFTGTLRYPAIGEAGRRFLADLLMQLSDRQLRDMFEAARVRLRPRDPGNGRLGFPAVDEWVSVFKQKRSQIVDRRCPS